MCWARRAELSRTNQKASACLPILGSQQPRVSSPAPSRREHLAHQFDTPHRGVERGLAAPDIEIRDCMEREAVDAQS